MGGVIAHYKEPLKVVIGRVFEMKRKASLRNFVSRVISESVALDFYLIY